MSKIKNYRDIKYELKETQGFYYCLVYAEGESTALFQTKYYASAERATSEAISFIDDYSTYRKKKAGRGRNRRSKLRYEKTFPPRSRSNSEIPGGQSSKPLESKSLTPKSGFEEGGRGIQRSKPLEARKITQSAKIWQENNQIRSSVPKAESNISLRSKSLEEKAASPSARSKDSKPKRKIRTLPVFLVAGLALLGISIIVGSASGFFQSVLSRDQSKLEITETVLPGAGIDQTTPRPTVALPEIIPSQTLAPTRTATVTPSITVTNFPTQPPITSTNTPRPTNPPASTSTFAPVPPASITPTPTNSPTLAPSQTPSPSPTNTPLPTAPSPADTPVTPSPSP